MSKQPTKRAKTSAKKKITTSTPKKRGGTFQCRWRALERFCTADELQVIDVVCRAELGGNNPEDFVARLRHGRVRYSSYVKLAGVLNCAVTNLYYDPHDLVPSRECNAFRFAQRVADLIEAGTIPEYEDKTKKKRTDVVQFVFQMGDPKLDNISMTFEEEREAYFILRDHFLAVVEREVKGGPYRKLIGKMEVGVTPIEDIFDDLDKRESLSGRTFDTLSKQFREKGGAEHFHIKRIRSELMHRFGLYEGAVKADQQHEVKEGSTKVYQLTTPSSIDAVIEADFYLRMIVFPTQAQDETFLGLYRRSRRVIESVRERQLDKFVRWWPGFRDRNTEDLKKFVAAWKIEKPTEEPEWMDMMKALSDTVERTKTAIETYYLPTPGVGTKGG